MAKWKPLLFLISDVHGHVTNCERRLEVLKPQQRGLGDAGHELDEAALVLDI
jgi:hypothetical protein